MLHDIRLTRCFQYRMRGLTRAAAIYLSVFALFDIILPAALYLFIGQRLNSTDGGFQISFGGQSGSFTFLFSTMIFLFVGACASFREDFHQLLALNNTRRNQFISSILSMLAAAVAFTLCGIVARLLEIVVESMVNQKSPASQLAEVFGGFFSGRTTAAALAMLLAYAAVFLAAYAFGMLAGILSYRFNRLFIIPFWICFGTSFVVVPILATQNKLFQAFVSWFFGSGAARPELNLAAHLALLALILLAAGGLFHRKLPQAA